MTEFCAFAAHCSREKRKLEEAVKRQQKQEEKEIEKRVFKALAVSEDERTPEQSALISRHPGTSSTQAHGNVSWARLKVAFKFRPTFSPTLRGADLPAAPLCRGPFSLHRLATVGAGRVKGERTPEPGG